METEFLSIIAKYTGFVGLAIGVFFLLFRDVIRKNIFSTLTKKQSYNLLLLIVTFIFITTIMAFYFSYYFGQVKNIDDNGVALDYSELVKIRNIVDTPQRKGCIEWCEENGKSTEGLEGEHSGEGWYIWEDEIKYPQITNHPSRKIQFKINELLKIAAEENVGPLDYKVRYEIKVLAYNTLSVVYIWSGSNIGGGSGISGAISININLVNAKKIKITDIFFLEQLENLSRTLTYCLGRKVNHDYLHQFYISQETLTFQYDSCAGAASHEDIDVHFRDIIPYVKPGGILGFLLDDADT